MGLDLCLGQVSWKYENVQHLAILHCFIEENAFLFQTDLYLLLRLANLPHKCKGLDQRLAQVSSNYENVQNLAVLHGFIKTSVFSFITNL